MMSMTYRRATITSGLCGLLLTFLLAAPAVAQVDVKEMIKDVLNDSDHFMPDDRPPFLEAGADAVPGLFEQLTEQRFQRVAEEALQAIVHHASRPGAESERAAVEAALIDELDQLDDQYRKTYAIRLLSFVGADAAVDRLAGLLKDSEYQEIARWSLTRIPGPASAQVLVDELNNAEGRFKAGLLQAVAEVEDEAVGEALHRALVDDHREVRMAAIEALGRRGNLEDAPRLQDLIIERSDWQGNLAVASYLQVAEQNAADHPAEARQLYRNLLPEHYEEPEFPRYPDFAVAGALAGLGEVARREDWDVLLAAVQSQVEMWRTAAQRGLEKVEAEGLESEIADVIYAASPGTQRLLVTVLKNRGTDAARGLLAEVVDRAEHERVQMDALAALASYGSDADVITLVRALREEGPLSDEARRQLVTMSGPGVTHAITTYLDRSPIEYKEPLVRILGERREAEALEALLDAAKEDDQGIRLAAYWAMGELNNADAVDNLIAVLSGVEEIDARAAEDALRKFRGKASREAMVDHLDKVDENVQVILLNVLADQRKADIADTFAKYAQSNNSDVRLAAVNALTSVPSEAGLDVFREYARSDDEGIRQSAIRGMVSVAVQRDDKGAALDLLDEAMEAAQSSGMKQEVLRGYGQIDSIAAVERLQPYMDDPDLGAVAGEALLARADSLHRNDAEAAVNLVKRIAAESTNPGRVAQAVNKLRDWKADIHLQDYGFVTEYWLAGPYPGREALKESEETPAGDPIDTDGKFEAVGESHGWEKVSHNSTNPVIDLERHYRDSRFLDAGAFLFTNLESDKDQAVELWFGSDDDLIVWLNGEKVHETYGDRGHNLGQDKVKAQLKEGSNQLVLKVLQGKGGWAVASRVVGEDGGAVRIR